MEFPLGLFGIALATVTLPYLSRLWNNDDKEQFSRTLDWSLRLALVVAVPAALGLFLLAEPLIATLFYRGEFVGHDVEMTALALRAYAFGLVGFSFVKILAPAFFAREDTRTPVRIGIIALGVNLALSIGFAWYLTHIEFEAAHAGLALATSIAALLNAWMLYLGLRKAEVLAHGDGWRALGLQVLAGNAAMWMALAWLQRDLSWWLESNLLERSVWLLLSVSAGAAAYALVLLATGMRPAHFNMRDR
jgi:putative peptidoglycan lipid II flippase